MIKGPSSTRSLSPMVPDAQMRPTCNPSQLSLKIELDGRRMMTCNNVTYYHVIYLQNPKKPTPIATALRCTFQSIAPRIKET